MLDGLVREIDVIPADDGQPAAAAAGGSDAVVEADDLLVDVPPVADRPRTGRFSESTFTAEAGTRSFKLFEPAGFEGRALPLVVMLHGCTQNPDDFAAGTRMNALAQEQGLFVLYPAQAPRSNAHKCWNWFQAGDQRRGHGEPALLAGMTRHVMATHPDRRRPGLGRRPLGRRRDGGDPGARVSRPVRRRRRALRPAARRRARRGVGVLGDEVRRPRRAGDVDRRRRPADRLPRRRRRHRPRAQRQPADRRRARQRPGPGDPRDRARPSRRPRLHPHRLRARRRRRARAGPSTGWCTAPAMPGSAATPPAATPTAPGPTPRGRCCASSPSIRAGTTADGSPAPAPVRRGAAVSGRRRNSRTRDAIHSCGASP